MKLLIGYDGSDSARDAIESLQKAGLPFDTEALVVAAAEMFEAAASPSPVAASAVTAAGALEDLPLTIQEFDARAVAARAEARNLAIAGGRLVQSLFPTWSVRSEEASDLAYRALVERADAWHADLILTGSHGRSTLGRLFMGSVSQQVLSHAPCSVRIGRPAETYLAPPRLLLAIDGSADSAAAVEAIMLRAWPAGTHVRVVTAVDWSLLGVAPLIGLASAQSGEDAPEVLFRVRADAVVEQLRDLGLLADRVVTVGEPRRVLLDEAENWHADCIFIGAKGHGRIAKALLGSVSATIAARANCSVEVVR